MRIGIDASCILPPRTGVGTYALELLRMLPKAGAQHRFVVFLNSLRRKQPREAVLERPNVEVRRCRIPGPLLLYSWRTVNFPPIDWLTGPVDVFHSPASWLPPQRRGARVATVHDLHFAKRPEDCHALGGGYLRAVFPSRLKLMHRVITPTESVRRELIEMYGLAPQRVRAIAHGADTRRFHPIEDAGRLEGARRSHGLPADFILTVCALEPRKNIEGLLRGYRRLRGMMKDAPALVVVGGKGWKFESIFSTARALGLAEGREVIFTGRVPDEDLPLLYNSARLFVLASREEGFGLPALEAMACGAPTMTSKAAGLLEVVGEAAARVDADDPEAMAEKMREILSDESLRRTMREASLQRAKLFSWEQCARETLEVYEEAAEEAAGGGNSGDVAGTRMASV